MAYIGAQPSYGVFDRQVLTGDGSTTTFNLDHMAVPTSLLVVLDGVVQEPEYSYSTALSSGQPQITFSEAPDAAGRASIVYLGNEVLTATSATSQTHIDEFNGDGSTLTFTLTRTPAANNAANYAVFVDNVYQRYGSSYSYTVAGSTLTFTSAPPSGTNNIQVIQLNGVNTLNTVADGAISRVKLDFDPEDDATALAIALG
ncbi:MAG: hypothetical protein CBC12_05900 [Candidatus Puniceispirillum sp. TMED52]|nr:MAG: hypothetical protein CBC12_05900 [Candidatus Puniceispirillum sp. TMED52]